MGLRQVPTGMLLVALLLLAGAFAGSGRSVLSATTVEEGTTLKGGAATPCTNGFAGEYPCQNVDLLAHLSLEELGAAAGIEGSDLWGWSDTERGREYALMTLTNATAFVDITDPENPVYLGSLPGHNGISTWWRDVKVYKDHAFIVADNSPGHGVQVFDLTRLREVKNPPVTFTNDGHYPLISSAHNIAINEDSGYAYTVGGESCNGGLHMIDISTPISPVAAGCFSADGYTHDTQCIIYHGVDEEHQEKEICFNSNEDTLTIVDVTNKLLPEQLSRTEYEGSAYTHQGWLTEDHQFFLLGDELDESSNGHNTRTYIWDVSDLDAPQLVGAYTALTPSIDHNLYIRGHYMYQANYTAGLRIIDISNIANSSLKEVAYFDVHPANNAVGFHGAWSNYPYFESGTVIVSSIERGLFILRPHLEGDPVTPTPTATQEATVTATTGVLTPSPTASGTVMTTPPSGTPSPTVSVSVTATSGTPSSATLYLPLIMGSE